ncbi:hypothetical protein NMY22_g12409 [Coprinellus aureogranulatus]|nr:hypothetical protein NMY22_g12409 [Coprinellus aureogranulatus]
MQNLSESGLSPEPEFRPPLPFTPNTPPQEIWGTLYDKFYEWHHHECLTLLGQLSAELDDNNSDEEPFRDLLDLTARENRSRGLDSEHFEFIEYAEDGEEEDAVLIEAVVEDEATHRTFNRKWEPNPRYTSCTPMAFNITNLGEKKRLTASFLWYSDDPTFNLQRFQSLHHHLAWQTDFWDPDHEAIKMETVRLLHFQQGLELWHIDELKLPTFPKIRKNSADGLVWQSSQR